MTNLSAALYARISDDKQGDALGVGRQLVDLKAMAKREGWNVVDEYVDNDLSAYSGKRRPAYERLLEDVEAKRFDVIAAWHPDRLHRAPVELEKFIDVVERTGVEVRTVTAGTLDLATPSGRAVARTLGTWARYESEHKAERIRRKHLEMAEAGKSTGGSRPFGYELGGMIVIPAEAELIREAADRVLAGGSVRGICIDWNGRGITTATGGRWQQVSLRRTLMSPRIAGLRAYHGKVIADAVWPAIIDRDQHRRLVDLLGDPSRRRTPSGIRARSYLLSGFLRCSLCEKPLRARPKQDGSRRYVCASGPMFEGCGRIAVLSEPLDEFIVDSLVKVVDSPTFTAKLHEREHDLAAHGEVESIAADEAALAELATDYYAERRLTRAEYDAAAGVVRTRLDAARRRLSRRAQTDAVGDHAGQLEATWPAQSLDQQRQMIGAVIDRIVVGPGRRGLNRFDPSRIDVEWRV